METLSTSDLNELFVDVRKAYRLLYFYQRRLLDTVEYISSVLNESRVNGYSIFWGKPFDNEDQIDFKWSAWDWLPMFCYEFKFADKIINNNNYIFAVAVYADNGFENARDGILHTDVDQFVNVEQAETQLYFYVGKNVWKPEEFDTIWKDKQPREYEYLEGDKQFLSLRFSLSKFKDEDGIMEGLREFKKYCFDKGMTAFLAKEL